MKEGFNGNARLVEWESKIGMEDALEAFVYLRVIFIFLEFRGKF